ncbi:MAG: transcription antitermination factor NusB [Myxococcota bacterium]|jgi:N utilization substance protein B|nr:transcription antitermination factor NusB [Myxococcota bacterium]
MGSRRKGREAALQMLYQMDVGGSGAEDAIRAYWAHLGENEGGDGADASDAGMVEFANMLVRGFATHRARIDETIRSVSHHWRLERMTRVDRNILRLATFELLELTDVPRRVTLNEAIELAKRFGSEGSAGFVNGVLDRIAGDLGKS